MVGPTLVMRRGGPRAPSMRQTCRPAVASRTLGLSGVEPVMFGLKLERHPGIHCRPLARRCAHKPKKNIANTPKARMVNRIAGTKAQRAPVRCRARRANMTTQERKHAAANGK